ncbi:MAG: class I SAM-dependent methyltransferase [Rubrivivax sp.]
MATAVAPEARVASQAHGAVAQPSAWVVRWQDLVAPGARVLDLACGSGRHVRHLAACGFRLTAVDRDNQALQPLADCAETLCADLETGPWPLAGRQFDGVLVTHYLWRPRWPALRECLAPGGVLIYETFAHGQQTVGRPSRPEFLLQPGELLQLASGLRVVAYEDGFIDAPARFIQRIVAVRVAAEQPATTDGQLPIKPPVRYPLPS